MGLKHEISKEARRELLANLEYINECRHDAAGRISELYERARKDVTGLYSKVYLTEYINKSSNTIPLAYIMCDIDKFKTYNDSYGHLQGDVALTTVAKRFEYALKQKMNPHETFFAARYGGEEFCAFIEHYEDNKDDLHSRIDGIRSSIQNLELPLFLGSAGFSEDNYKRTTITIAASIKRKDEPIGNLVDRVDRALIGAKKKDKRNSAIVL